MERESRNNHGKNNLDLATYLRDYLNNRYANVLWVVTVYDDISGWDAHTVVGQFYHLFRHYGHNIVVSRITEPYSTKAPVDINGKFTRALSTRWKETCSNSWCWSKTSRIDAKPTVDATWSNLYGQGLNPVMLHIIRGGTGWGVATYTNSRVHHRQLSDGGLAVLLAVAQ